MKGKVRLTRKDLSQAFQLLTEHPNSDWIDIDLVEVLALHQPPKLASSYNASKWDENMFHFYQPRSFNEDKAAKLKKEVEKEIDKISSFLNKEQMTDQEIADMHTFFTSLNNRNSDNDNSV